MNILGINAYHGDSSAALLQDGELIAAVEEERFNRVKHWAGFPAESIRYCLESGGLEVHDLDHIAVSFNPRANFSKRLGFVLKHRPSASAILNRLRRQRKVFGIKENLAEVFDCESNSIAAPVHHVEHHANHVASGFLISPYEKAAILSVDGMGDFVSTMTAIGEGTSWKVLDRTFYPHSIGFLYNALTIYLGFPHYGDEYKVMGLAPYGEPRYADFFRKLIRPKGDSFELNLDYFTHHKQGINMAWESGNPTVEAFHSEKLENELGPARDPSDDVEKFHEDVAKSLQVVTEEIIMHLLNRLHDRTKVDKVCVVGGVAMNSVANGKITTQTPFKEAFIPGGAADNGTAFGSAFYVWNRILGNPRKFQLKHSFLGCESSDDECRLAIEVEGLSSVAYDESELCECVVSALTNGKVVGWFQGKMEFGARALGSRSLIADPRRTDMRDIINLKIKFREKFRPFAPSILAEHVGEYFEIDEPSPFMEKVFQIKPEKHEIIPAVTHVDGTGRLQTVTRDTNQRYYDLIKCFYEKTGVPIILNTSLNENEPIVRTPAEAISVFNRTAMDMLVLGNNVIERPS
ncbi:MAG: carbamoyltransferase C-terminal domain-containing protein [Verrucomicrobiota bacterium]